METHSVDALWSDLNTIRLAALPQLKIAHLLAHVAQLFVGGLLDILFIEGALVRIGGLDIAQPIAAEIEIPAVYDSIVEFDVFSATLTLDSLGLADLFGLFLMLAFRDFAIRYDAFEARRDSPRLKVFLFGFLWSGFLFTLAVREAI